MFCICLKALLYSPQKNNDQGPAISKGPYSI